MDDVIINALRVQVNTRGLMTIATLLGHNNTQTLRRWLKEGRIPDGKVFGTRLALESHKLIKPLKGQK